MIRRLAPATLGVLILLLACTDMIGPRGGNGVRLVVQPSFGQVPATAAADNPASRVDNVHVVLKNAAGTTVLDTIIEWPLNQDTLRMEMDVVVQEQETFELTIEGRSGDRVLFKAGPTSLELSEDDEGSTVATSPVLEYAGPGAEVASVEITGAPAAFVAGGTVALGAAGTNDDGSDAGDLIIIWTSLDPDAATVDEDGGVQVGHDASRAVSIEGRVAFTTVSDTIGGPILPAELTVTPDASTLNALGAELTLTASPLGEDGGAVTGVAIEWSVADPSVLELTSEGAEASAVATALTQGATRVFATAGELSDSADVTVDQTVARLDMEPDTVTLEQIGATSEATAAAFDANDNEVEDAEVAWSSGAEDVATVAEDGTITAVSPGTAWITARSDEASDSLLATVANAAPELAITAPADGATFGEGDTITFEGTAEDLEDGDLSASIQWSSDLDGELGTGASLAVDDLSIGSHTIMASVSDSGELADSVTIGIEVTLPNLVLADLTVEASEPLTSDDTVRLAAEIVNAGQVESAAADVAVRVLDGADEAVLGRVIVEVPALSAGETFSLLLDLSEADLEDVSELEVEGDSIIFEVEVDPDDAIAETDETDNAQRSRPFEVEVEVDLPPGVTSGWVGTSSDWQDPSNWYPVGVPTAEDVVVIPASADAQPVLTASTTVGGLFLEDGAILDVNGHTLTVTGDLDAGSTIVDGTGGGSHDAVVMTGEGASLQGTVPDLLITGQVGTVGTVQVMNGLEVAGDGAEFHVGPHLVRVGDDLLVGAGGTIQMHDAEGVLDVADNVELSSSGGATSVAVAGLLVVGSDFRATVVTGDGPAFFGSGTHRTIMAGTGPGAIEDGAIEIEAADGSSFGHLELVGAYDIAFVGGVATVDGDLAVAMDGALAADDVFVFGGLTAATESTVRVGRLHLRGAMEIAADAGFLVDEFFFAGDGQVIQAGLPYQDIGVFGRAALGGATTVASSLHVAGEGAELTVGPHHLTVGSHFTTAAGGILRMEDPDGVLDANGFGAGFTGGESVLTAGTIRVSGDLFQGSDADGNGKRAFRAGPGLLTVFDGSGTQTIEMHDPGPPDGDFSFLGTLEVAHTGDGLFLIEDVHATGPLVVPAGPEPAIFGGGFNLTTAGLDVDGLTLDATPLMVHAAAGAPMRFDNVVFRAYDDPPDMTQLTLVHPGAADPFAFDGLTFDVQSAAGPVVDARDSNQLEDDPVFTVVMSNTVPTDGSDLVATDGVAVITWADSPALPDGATMGWTGRNGTGWANADNWNPARIPGTTDVVHIPAGPANQPRLGTHASVGGLMMESGATVDIGSFDLAVEGDVDAGATVVGSTGRVVLTAQGTSGDAGTTLQATVPNLLVQGQILAAGLVTVAGDLVVDGSGSRFDVGGQAVTVGGSLWVENAGELRMTVAEGVLDVEGSATFRGTSTEGDLTAGTLRVAGNFTQDAGDGAAFAPSGSHRTVLDGSSAQSVSINNTAANQSRFHHLEVTNPAGVTFLSDAYANGDLSVSGSSLSHPGTETLTVAGGVTSDGSSSFTLNRLNVGGAQAVANPGGYSVTSTGLTGPGQSLQSDLHYENVVVSGTVAASGSTSLSGGLTVSGSGSRFDVGGQAVTVGGSLRVENAGELGMTDAEGVLDVEGSATFRGTSTEGDLTAGTLRVAGNFTQDAGDGAAFAPSGSHTTVLDGGSAQKVSINNTAANQSRFHHLEITNTVGVDFASTLYINGSVEVASAAAAVTGGTVVIGQSLTATKSQWLPSVTEFTGSFASRPTGFAKSLRLNSAIVLTANLDIGGDLTINGPNNYLDVGAFTVTVAGNLDVRNSAWLVMQDAAGVLDVEGDATFRGASTDGKLTEGALRVAGDFSQPSGTTAFAPSGSHRTILDGAAAQNVSFADPEAASSRFHDLEIINASAGGATFSSDAFVNGVLVSSSESTPALSASGSLLTAANVNVDGLSLDGLRIRLTSLDGTSTFDNVTFGTYDTSVTQLTVNTAAGTEPFTFNGLTFNTAPTLGQGYYMALENTDTSGSTLTISVTGAEPSTPSADAVLVGPNSTLDWNGSLLN